MGFFQNRHSILIAGILVAIAIAALLFFQRTDSESQSYAGSDSAIVSNPLITPRVLGDPNAPVTIIEYSSMTCHHCAEFHRNALPQIKKAYIDTGKVKLEMRDFPLDDRAAIATLMARCTTEERYFPLVDLIFAQQQKWARSQDLIGDLSRLGGFAGMSSETLEACFTNEALYQAIAAQRDVWRATHEIQSTPTFYINDVQVVGAQDFEIYQNIIEDALN